MSHSNIRSSEPNSLAKKKKKKKKKKAGSFPFKDGQNNGTCTPQESIIGQVDPHRLYLLQTVSVLLVRRCLISASSPQHALLPFFLAASSSSSSPRQVSLDSLAFLPEQHVSSLRLSDIFEGPVCMCNHLSLSSPFCRISTNLWLQRDSKRKERTTRFASLPPQYYTPLTADDKGIINKPIGELVAEIQKGLLSPVDVVLTYGKVAVKAHGKTNCVTELMLPDAESWARSEINLKGPLAGIPVSLKDSVQVNGFDSSIGYGKLAGKPFKEDGPMVQLLKAAG